ncbi:competence type IV pilus major pilin ComGC [Streptococcus sp. DD12]|uniref:competence type IV pilus major pilin ComGC n=1 Tax=Streptococcus sp. DD12 TaxID=1777880 RepID=UPI000791F35B|nr:competence type IV pilus major pilin ComGC [Streptococcus sp. DD12]KXT75385.1 Late competence protein ComGC, access of DNA to ComEA [Streptococcus sp. DD12]
MKKLIQSCRAKTAQAFTLIEMLVVLLIISVLLLLFVPNLTKQKDTVKDTGGAAIVKVVEAQAELYEMNGSDSATLAKLVSNGSLTKEQVDSYKNYYAKHHDQTQKVSG